MAFSLILISLNLIGSFVYHSFRGALIWVLLDSLPIALLTVFIAVHYVRRVFRAWYATIAVIAIPVIIIFSFHSLFKLSPDDRPNISYFAIGIPLVFTMVTYLGVTNWNNWKLMAGAVACVIIAIFCRIADTMYNIPFLYMGTHWLWHIFSTISAHLLLTYMYLDDVRRQRKYKSLPEATFYLDAG